jgi:hypothetical protein
MKKTKRRKSNAVIVVAVMRKEMHHGAVRAKIRKPYLCSLLRQAVPKEAVDMIAQFAQRSASTQAPQ